MFHADLIYLRANINALKEILASEEQAPGGTNKTNRTRRSLQPTPLRVSPRVEGRASPSARRFDR